MLTTDIIKWAIEEFMPEGFTWRQAGFCYGVLPMHDIRKYIRDGLYSLFLQRVTEGINKTYPERLQIAQCGYSVQVLCDGNREVLHNIDLYGVYGNLTPDQAKEQAIEYICNEVHK